MIVVDASIMVSVFVPQDSHNIVSKKGLTDYIAKGQVLVAPVILLPEVAGPIMRQTGAKILALRMLIDSLTQQK